MLPNREDVDLCWGLSSQLKLVHPICTSAICWIHYFFLGLEGELILQGFRKKVSSVHPCSISNPIMPLWRSRFFMSTLLIYSSMATAGFLFPPLSSDESRPLSQRNTVLVSDSAPTDFNVTGSFSVPRSISVHLSMKFGHEAPADPILLYLEQQKQRFRSLEPDDPCQDGYTHEAHGLSFTFGPLRTPAGIHHLTNVEAMLAHSELIRVLDIYVARSGEGKLSLFDWRVELAMGGRPGATVRLAYGHVLGRHDAEESSSKD